MEHILEIDSKLRKDRYIFFVKDTVKEQIAQEKEHLYKLYKQGLLQLVEEEDALNSDITYCDEYYCYRITKINL